MKGSFHSFGRRARRPCSSATHRLPALHHGWVRSARAWGPGVVVPGSIDSAGAGHDGLAASRDGPAGPGALREPCPDRSAGGPDSEVELARPAHQNPPRSHARRHPGGGSDRGAYPAHVDDPGPDCCNGPHRPQIGSAALPSEASDASPNLHGPPLGVGHTNMSTTPVEAVGRSSGCRAQLRRKIPRSPRTPLQLAWSARCSAHNPRLPATNGRANRALCGAGSS